MLRLQVVHAVLVGHVHVHVHHQRAAWPQYAPGLVGELGDVGDVIEDVHVDRPERVVVKHELVGVAPHHPRIPGARIEVNPHGELPRIS